MGSWVMGRVGGVLGGGNEVLAGGESPRGMGRDSQG